MSLKSLKSCVVVVVLFQSWEKTKFVGWEGAGERWERITNPAGLHPGHGPEMKCEQSDSVYHCWQLTQTQHMLRHGNDPCLQFSAITPVNVVNTVHHLQHTWVRNFAVPWTPLWGETLLRLSGWMWQTSFLANLLYLEYPFIAASTLYTFHVSPLGIFSYRTSVILQREKDTICFNMAKTLPFYCLMWRLSLMTKPGTTVAAFLNHKDSSVVPWEMLIDIAPGP